MAAAAFADTCGVRRTFALVVFPLALVALAPTLLIHRLGAHEHNEPPWGIDARHRAALQQDGAARGLRADSVFVTEAGAGRIDEAPILLEGRTAAGRRCAFVVRGSTAGPLHCLDVVLRSRPLWTLVDRPPGMPGIQVLGILRRDVERIATVDAQGRLTGLDILEPGHVFNLVGLGSTVRLRLYGRGGRVVGDVGLRG